MAANPYTVPLALAAYGVLFAALYTVLMVAMSRRPAAGAPPSGGVTRRELLSRAVTVLIASAAAGAAAQWLGVAPRRATIAAESLFGRGPGLPSEVTPDDQFYIVRQNPP